MEPAKEFIEYFNNPNLTNQQAQMLNHVRDIIHQFYPEVIEKTSYAMPAFFPVESKKATEVLMMIAANKNWLGVYALPDFNEEYSDELSRLGIKFGRGSIQVPYDIREQDLNNLIRAVIKFNLKRFGFNVPETVE